METQERKAYATDFGVEKGLPKEEVVYTGLPSAPQVCLGEPWVTFSPSIIIVSAPYTLIWTINNNGHMTFKKTAQSNLIPHYLHHPGERPLSGSLILSLTALCQRHHMDSPAASLSPSHICSVFTLPGIAIP